MKMPYKGGFIDLGAIPAEFEGKVLAVNLVPARMMASGTAMEQYWEIGVNTMTGVFAIRSYDPAQPNLELQKDYYFICGVTHNSYSKATQPNVSLIAVRPVGAASAPAPVAGPKP